MRKKRYQERSQAIEGELGNIASIIAQYQEDMTQLEEKLATAREKQRILVQRHIRAQSKRKTQKGIRKFDTSDAMMRFEKFEGRIDRMEAEADLVNYGVKPTLSDEISKLEEDEDIEKELAELKSKKKGE